MSNIKQFLIPFFLILTTSGCVISENIDFNEDYSGSYSLRMGIDFAGVFDYFSDEEEEDASLVEGNSILYFDEIFSENLNKNSAQKKEVELSKEVDVIKKSLALGSDVKTSATFEFESVKQLDSLLNVYFVTNFITSQVRNAYSIKKTGIELKQSDLIFSRKSKILEDDQKESIEIDNASDSKNSEDYRLNKLMMKYMKYRSSYTFPKEIKSVKSGNAIIGVEKKKILLKPSSIARIIKDPLLLDFELNFKD